MDRASKQMVQNRYRRSRRIRVEAPVRQCLAHHASTPAARDEGARWHTHGNECRYALRCTQCQYYRYAVGRQHFYWPVTQVLLLVNKASAVEVCAHQLHIERRWYIFSFLFANQIYRYMGWRSTTLLDDTLLPVEFHCEVRYRWPPHANKFMMRMPRVFATAPFTALLIAILLSSLTGRPAFALPQAQRLAKCAVANTHLYCRILDIRC